MSGFARREVTEKPPELPKISSMADEINKILEGTETKTSVLPDVLIRPQTQAEKDREKRFTLN